MFTSSISYTPWTISFFTIYFYFYFNVATTNFVQSVYIRPSPLSCIQRWWVKHYVVKGDGASLCSHFHCQTPRYPHSLPSELCLHSQATNDPKRKSQEYLMPDFSNIQALLGVSIWTLSGRRSPLPYREQTPIPDPSPFWQIVTVPQN